VLGGSATERRQPIRIAGRPMERERALVLRETNSADQKSKLVLVVKGGRLLGFKVDSKVRSGVLRLSGK
jgi:hypothetical protein